MTTKPNELAVMLASKLPDRMDPASDYSVFLSPEEWRRVIAALRSSVPSEEEIFRLSTDPHVIAAAWRAWQERPQFKLGPGPGFREAVASGLKVALARLSPTVVDDSAEAPVGGKNPIEAAVASAAKELLKRPASRRGPFVISDDELRHAAGETAPDPVAAPRAGADGWYGQVLADATAPDPVAADGIVGRLREHATSVILTIGTDDDDDVRMFRQSADLIERHPADLARARAEGRREGIEEAAKLMERCLSPVFADRIRSLASKTDRHG